MMTIICFHSIITLLYHFNQFDTSHVTDPTVVSKIGLCYRSQRPVSDRSNLWQRPKTENLVKKRMFVLVFTKFGSCGLLPHPIGRKYSQKSPIRALLQSLSVEILALSRSPATCVEVSNWSNGSQSQGCVELIEMVQYIIHLYPIPNALRWC